MTFLLLVLSACPLRAGFTGTDVFIPAVARVGGFGGSQFYSTLWITNLSTSVASFQILLLQQGQANPAPLSKTDTLAAGATRRYDNIVQLFGVSGIGAALHILSDRELFVSSRTYDQPPGTDLKDVKGLFFSGIPASFAIGTGETSRLQGITNGPLESFRYNFGLVETTGQPVTVTVTVKNESGNVTNTQQYLLGASEARQVNAFFGYTPPVSTTDSILEATVTGGTGKVLLYGTQIAGSPENPGSNDGSGFEMSFKSSLIAPGVASLNGLFGALTLVAAAPNVTITPSGSTITIGVAASSPLALPYAGSAGVAGGPVFTIANTSTGSGIQANSTNQAAIYGNSVNSRGVWGQGGAYGVRGDGGTTGVHGEGVAVGVHGVSPDKGVIGEGGSFGTSYGVYGSGNTYGVYGTSNNYGVFGDGFTGVFGIGSAYGVYGMSSGVAAGYFASGGGTTWAGFFDGMVRVTGNLIKPAGSFKIDHPLDPANQYLSHSFVESPDMMNVYNGVVVTDATGEADVSLPEYFEALNRDFRYQLTVIGEFAQAIVGREVQGNHFLVRTSKPNIKVSWQVTGIRQDVYANAHRIVVEEEKPAAERGLYLYPRLFGQPEDKGVDWAKRAQPVSGSRR